MHSAGRPRWQQMTALVSLGAGGAVTGFSFVPGTVADLTSPAGMPIRLMALQQAARPTPADDATLRSAIVNVASYYLQMAQRRTPAEMEALIWQHDSIDGVDHGESCAAFASLTLELAAQVVGQQSWVTGGTTYPWPLHKWADVRVDPNPSSLGITSVLQDAQAHHRWHPLGDGYQPLPGDWVLFNGHVEVVTAYAGGVLHTVGGDSLPNLSVNAHEYRDPLGPQGVAGFVNNGALGPSPTKTPRSHDHASGSHPATGQASPATGQADPGLAAIPGAPPADAATPGRRQRQARTAPDHLRARQPTQPAARQPARQPTQPAARQPTQPAARQPARQRAPRSARRPAHPPAAPAPSALGVTASVPGAGIPEPAAAPRAARKGSAAIPGLSVTAYHVSLGSAARPAAPYRRHRFAAVPKPVPDSAANQAFISEVAPGAVAAQRKYGVPASVTIAQAIDESGWGRSSLAARDHNLFGIKGTGPAGSDPMHTQEYDNGQSVARIASFRVYHNFAESIDDHGKLLATSEYYQRSMAYRQDPNAFAATLTGVYATDPDYGAKLISLMRQYDLYRYDVPAPAAAPREAGSDPADIPGLMAAAAVQPVSPSTQAASAEPLRTPVTKARRRTAPDRARTTARTSTSTSRYQHCIPLSVKNAFISRARTPLLRAEPLYRDVASHRGISWELLAACDWMQCQARPRLSPVHGEKLGTLNPDGTMYRTKSAALQQCCDDLAELARTVYRIDLTARTDLSVRDLANVFAAFRWGGLLRLHRTSAMEFPYSVAGLTAQHLSMRWPDINEPHTPDKPGSRFRLPFGAVPVVLGLNYPATV
jgi:flagellum-specific peptidoglycan hydrolase FlgJ